MTAPAVQLRAAELAYEGVAVLSRIDMRIETGEIVSIIGGSGSGKSTLLRAMTGLLPPRSGSVELFGEDLYALPASRRGHLLGRTGFVFQRDALFGSMTVLRNVMFPAEHLADLPSAVTEELARIKLGVLGIADLAERAPAEVSGGQAKRVALARATVLDPDLILCDEPTGGLDPINARALGQLLLRLREDYGTAVVVVTHDIRTVRQVSDRALVVGRGRIEASGTPRELERSELDNVRAFFLRDPDPAEGPRQR